MYVHTDPDVPGNKYRNPFGDSSDPAQNNGDTSKSATFFSLLS